MTLQVGTRLGPYEILGHLGSGGMGEVYRARDRRLGRTVALKTIRISGAINSDATERLLTEARAASAVSHPNITHIYDIGECDGVTYVAMEYVEGISLEARLAVGPLPVADVIAIGTALASAFAETHRRGVIHRDIKPANILLTPAGQVKVLDFGLAKLGPLFPSGESTLGQTAPGVVMGTAHYMSPEQALGRHITPATDIFSLGVVLYRMAAGVLPFKGASMTEVLDRILHAEPLPLTDFRSDLPLELQRAIRCCLEKDSAARFADGSELATALAAIASRAVSPPTAKVAIAVLPFEDLSPGKDSEYFSNGLTEEVTADLTRVGSLGVVSRTSASRYKGGGKDVRTIAAELNVRYVLEGSVRKAGDALRITAQLIDAATDTHIWAETYKGTLEDVFEIQEQVARKIVDALMVKLSPAEKVTLGKRSTLDAEAFNLCLKGRHRVGVGTRTDLREALSLFEQALARDPRYAAAHAGVSEACAAYYESYERNEGWLDRAIESALTARMYDANLPEAYASLGLAYFNKGSIEESLTACRRAIDLDPDNWIGYWTLGRIHHVAGRPEEAVELLKRVVILNQDFYPAYFTLRMVCQALGKAELYQPYLMRLIDEVFPRYLEKTPDDARARNSYGFELSTAGRREEGSREAERALVQAPDDPMVLYATACYYAQFGDRTRALALLEQAIDAGYTNVAYIQQDPDLRPLHGEEAYRRIVRRAGQIV